jgi:hypothetical protein
MTGRGANTYKEKHQHELKRHQIAVESDSGNVRSVLCRHHTSMRHQVCMRH